MGGEHEVEDGRSCGPGVAPDLDVAYAPEFIPIPLRVDCCEQESSLQAILLSEPHEPE